jgi:hypothetical protein
LEAIRRRAFLPFVVSGLVGIALVAPAAWDSTLNLGIADDGGAQGEAGKANELAMCRALCASAPAAKRNTFRSRVSGSGSDCSKGEDCLRNFAGD